MVDSRSNFSLTWAANFFAASPLGKLSNISISSSTHTNVHACSTPLNLSCGSGVSEAVGMAVIPSAENAERPTPSQGPTSQRFIKDGIEWSLKRCEKCGNEAYLAENESLCEACGRQLNLTAIYQIRALVFARLATFWTFERTSGR
jgi:ribosomal protein L37E